MEAGPGFSLQKMCLHSGFFQSLMHGRGACTPAGPIVLLGLLANAVISPVLAETISRGRDFHTYPAGPCRKWRQHVRSLQKMTGSALHCPG